jgi:hypothetical protein
MHSKDSLESDKPTLSELAKRITKIINEEYDLSYSYFFNMFRNGLLNQI